MTKKSDQIRSAILQAIQDNPGGNPSSLIQKTFSISREAFRLHLQKLIESGMVAEEGYGKGRRYLPGPNFVVAEEVWRHSLLTRELKKKGEDQVFQDAMRPLLETRLNLKDVKRVQYAATEILNNVIDHSKSNEATITMSRLKDDFDLVIEDDGLGVFATIKKYFSLADMFEAAGELAKGKRTTDPSHHAGEGLFFSARMADWFSAEANSIKYTYSEPKDDWSIGPSEQTRGSRITLKFDLTSNKTTESVFDKFTKDYNFEEKSPRLVSPYIINLPKGDFPSRSQAKKILAGAEQFTSIVIDFKNVETIGQGFADEVFRVFQKQHPDIVIETVNANAFIERMIQHVKK